MEKLKNVAIFADWAIDEIKVDSFCFSALVKTLEDALCMVHVSAVQTNHWEVFQSSHVAHAAHVIFRGVDERASSLQLE